MYDPDFPDESDGSFTEIVLNSEGKVVRNGPTQEEVQAMRERQRAIWGHCYDPAEIMGPIVERVKRNAAAREAYLDATRAEREAAKAEWAAKQARWEAESAEAAKRAREERESLEANRKAEEAGRQFREMLEQAKARKEQAKVPVAEPELSPYTSWILGLPVPDHVKVEKTTETTGSLASTAMAEIRDYRRVVAGMAEVVMNKKW
jgi:hypothetical protein